MLEFLLNFYDYLNQNGYFLPQEKFTNYLEILKDFDPNDKKEIIEISKTVFAKSKDEYESIETLFNNFFEIYKNNLKIEKASKEKETLLNKRLKLESKLKELKENSVSKILETKDKDILKTINSLNPSPTDTLEDILVKLYEEMKKSLINSNIKAYEKQKDIYEKILKLLKAKKKEEGIPLKTKELEDLIKETNKNIHLKEKELTTHRETFIGYKASSNDSIDPLLSKETSKLNDKDLMILKNYLISNSKKFKTKLKKQITSSKAPELDIESTIRESAKTGGIPFKLIYKKPKEKDIKINLILDISGSCANSSKLMLTFFKSIHSVFRKGISSYVFVDSLYNVSSIIYSNNDNSIDKIFSIIPTRGVYSNYYNPLKTFACTKNIDKNTITIIIGDARNNQNPKATPYIKTIANKSKKAYFLCTEPKDKWGVSDSEILNYIPHIPCLEVLSTKDLLDFIENKLI